MYTTKLITIAAITSLLFTGCSNPSKQQQDAAGKTAAPVEILADRFADVQTLHYEIKGFEELPLQQKQLAYYLYMAGMSGRDIFYDQKYKHNLRIRKTIETVIETYSGDKNANDYKEFLTYAKRFFFSNGIHHHYSSDKMIPGFTAGYLKELIAKSDQSKLPLEGMTADAYADFLTPILFDPNVDAKNVDLSADKDRVLASANNFYEGVTEKEVEEFYKKMTLPNVKEQPAWGYNSKVVKENGALVERPWMVGGMYGASIEKMVGWLQKAVTVAENDTQKKTLEALIKYYQSGNPKDYDDYCISWVSDTASRIDFANGFIEVYMDHVSGRVIAYGARILITDPKSPKYINSPETEIYNKSKSLYGIYYAKKAIIQNDECLLVEGYTDVISLHQAGIENVVASSGTSLTQDQIRLISRYTKNVTILYDGDPAGIKASLRGIDLILEEGLNVKILLFPDGDDPDSYSKKVSVAELKNYIKENAKDFINFKTTLLLAEAANDPVKKAALIKDIVSSIAKIPDAILRSAYIKQCAVNMAMTEQVLITEMNKFRRDAFKKQTLYEEENRQSSDELFDSVLNATLPAYPQDTTAYQEQEIVRLLLNYGDREFNFQAEEQPEIKLSVRDFLLNEILTDGVGFDDEVLAGVFTYFSEASGKDFPRIMEELKSHNEEKIRNKAIELLLHRYDLHDWQSKGIFVKTEEINFSEAVVTPVYHLKLRRVLKLKKENQQQIKNYNDVSDELNNLLEKQKFFEQLIRHITKHLGIVVIE